MKRKKGERVAYLPPNSIDEPIYGKLAADKPDDEAMVFVKFDNSDKPIYMPSWLIQSVKDMNKEPEQTQEPPGTDNS